MRLARSLNCTAMQAEHAPWRWKGVALVDMEWQRLEAEKANKRHRRGAGTPATNPRRKR